MPVGFEAVGAHFDRVSKMLSPAGLRVSLTAIGEMAVEELDRSAVEAIGGDRMFSGWKRLGQLTATVKQSSQGVSVFPSPAGGWVVAEMPVRQSADLEGRTTHGGQVSVTITLADAAAGKIQQMLKEKVFVSGEDCFGCGFAALGLPWFRFGFPGLQAKSAGI